MSGKVSCKMRGAGCGEMSTCNAGKSAGSHPAIYTHEHTLNECSSTHCVAQESRCREEVMVINGESLSWRTIQRCQLLTLRARGKYAEVVVILYHGMVKIPWYGKKYQGRINLYWQSVHSFGGTSHCYKTVNL